MKTILAGPDGSAIPGEVIYVDNQKGQALIEGGYADPVDIEAASVEPPEKAVKARPRAKTTRAKK